MVTSRQDACRSTLQRGQHGALCGRFALDFIAMDSQLVPGLVQDPELQESLGLSTNRQSIHTKRRLVDGLPVVDRMCQKP